MKQMTLVLLLLSFLAGTLGATGDVGEACTGGTGGTCTNTHAYCNTNGICACKSSYVQKGTSCARVVDQPCGSGQCGNNLVCTSGACTACAAGEFKMDGTCVKEIGQTCTSVSQCGNVTGIKCDTRGGVQKCTCDTSANFYEGDDGNMDCSCAPGYAPKDSRTCGKAVLTCTSNASCVANAVCTNGDCVCASGFTASGNNCVKVHGDTCTGDAACAYTGGKCTSTHCACDTTGHFAAGSAGATSCSCDTGYTLNSARTACVGKIGTTCATAADCILGTTCANPGSGLVCACDTANHYAAGSAGADTCSCASGYVLNTDGTACVGKIGSDCTSVACIAGTSCPSPPSTQVCSVCDTSKKYVAGTAGDAACTCASGYVLNAGGTACVGKIGSDCTSVACIAGTTCIAGTKVCSTCETTKYFVAGTSGDATCSCASGYVINTAGTACVGKIGSACATTANCISGATCDRSVCKCDTTSNYAVGKIGDATCSCRLGHVLNAGSTMCVQGIVGTPCTSADQCVDHALCTSSICVCDTSKGYKANSAGMCVCDAGSNYAPKADGSCGKTPTQPCTADSDCIANAKCASAVCTCDATNHFIASGATCVCDNANNYYAKGTGCGKKPGQACQTTADCVDNADCTNSLCACNAAKGFAGTTTCTCSVANFARKWDGTGTCGKYIGQNCTTSADCIDNAVCDLATSLCACDADNGYSGSGGSCTCSVTNWAPTADSGCGKIASQTCEASPCADNAQCGAASGMCECNSGFIADTSKVCKSNGASMASASSLLLIVGALLLLC